MQDFKSATHTPGPWHVGMHPGPIVYGEHGEQVADMHTPMVPVEENRANARLIAAAPDLLAACRAALDRFEETLRGAKPSLHAMREYAPMLRAAIAKAEGGAR